MFGVDANMSHFQIVCFIGFGHLYDCNKNKK